VRSAGKSAALTRLEAFVSYWQKDRGENAMFRHDNAVDVRIDIEADPDGVLRHVMVIGTHLVTSRLVEGYDDSSITELVEAGVEFVNDHYSEINTIRIVHVPRDNWVPAPLTKTRTSMRGGSVS
jgi:hypothetical protein